MLLHISFSFISYLLYPRLSQPTLFFLLTLLQFYFQQRTLLISNLNIYWSRLGQPGFLHVLLLVDQQNGLIQSFFSIYLIFPIKLQLIMNKVANSIAQTTVRNLIPYSQFQSIKQKGEVLIVEIGKEPKQLFKNGLWIGNRNGGMASWLATLMPHLPQQKFCVYMDSDAYKQSEYMYSYYSDYFSKLFHNQYLGTCIHPRVLSNSKYVKHLKQVQICQLHNQFNDNLSQFDHTVLLDLRNYDSAKSDCLTREVRKLKNTSYINLPLNDDDLPELLSSKTNHLPQRTRFITLCAKGYRSLIGYSYLELVKRPGWKVQYCGTPFEQIKRQLGKQAKKQIKWQVNQQQAAYAMI